MSRYVLLSIFLLSMHQTDENYPPADYKDQKIFLWTVALSVGNKIPH